MFFESILLGSTLLLTVLFVCLLLSRSSRCKQPSTWPCGQPSITMDDSVPLSVLNRFTESQVRQQAVQERVRVWAKGCWARSAPIRRTLNMGKMTRNFTKGEIRGAIVGLKEIKAKNKQVNKGDYFNTEDLYWRAKFIHRIFRKQTTQDGYTTKLAPIYEHIAYWHEQSALIFHQTDGFFDILRLDIFG